MNSPLRVLVGALLLSLVAGEGVSSAEAPEDGYPPCVLAGIEVEHTAGLQLSNGLVRCTIAPALSGRIVELCDEADGVNLLMPYQALTHLRLTERTRLIIGNLGGLNDWVMGWGGIHSGEFEYQHQVTEQSPQSVAIRLSFACPGYELARTVRLARGSRRVELAIEFTPRGAAGEPRTYRSNLTLAPGGAVEPEHDHVFVPTVAPLTAGEQTQRLGQATDDMTAVEEGAIKHGTAYRGELAQGWRAVLDTRGRQGLLQLLDLDQLRGQSRQFFWFGDGVLSMDVFYPPRSAGDPTTHYQLTLVPLRGLERVDLAAADFAVARQGPARITLEPDTPHNLEVHLLPLRARGDTAWRVALLDDHGQIHDIHRAILPRPCPRQPTMQNIPLRAGQLPAGAYRLAMGWADAAADPGLLLPMLTTRIIIVAAHDGASHASEEKP